MLEHLSAEGRARGPGRLREFVTNFAGLDGVIGMHGGLPPAAAFPVASMSLTLTDGTSVPIADPLALYSAQQYNLSPLGYVPLKTWAQKLTIAKQKPARDDIGVLLTNGSTHSIELALRMLLNVGDAILVEEFLYSNSLEMVIQPLGFVPVAVELDSQGAGPAGMLPESLERSIERASLSGKRPRVLYIIPTAQNPTGAVMTLERKREIYAICQRHDIIILEDDPYFFLRWDGPGDVPGTDVEPSFLHLDVDGRVIRLDSFAKMLAPGFRLGWMSATEEMIQAMACAVQGSCMGPSGLSQVIIHSILEHWGDAGFEKHIRMTQSTYRERALALHEALTEHVGPLAEWNEPQAGMFLWLKILGVEDVGAIMADLVDHKVIVVPGKIFAVAQLGDVEYKCNWIRLAFSFMPPEQLREGAKRLGAVLRALPDAA